MTLLITREVRCFQLYKHKKMGVLMKKLKDWREKRDAILEFQMAFVEGKILTLRTIIRTQILIQEKK